MDPSVPADAPASAPPSDDAAAAPPPAPAAPAPQETDGAGATAHPSTPVPADLPVSTSAPVVPGAAPLDASAPAITTSATEVTTASVTTLAAEPSTTTATAAEPEATTPAPQSSTATPMPTTLSAVPTPSPAPDPVAAALEPAPAVMENEVKADVLTESVPAVPEIVAEAPAAVEPVSTQSPVVDTPMTEALVSVDVADAPPAPPEPIVESAAPAAAPMEEPAHGDEDAMDVDAAAPALEQTSAETETVPKTEKQDESTTAAPESGEQDQDTGVPVTVEEESEQRTLEEQAKSYLVQQIHPVIIPSYAAWFDMNTINDIERKSLPEFFNNRNRSKTPTAYRDYRDFMINTYRLNPIEYLTVTACRRNLAGDVCAIMRVHAFLEQWGLINYQIDAESRPSSIGPPFTGHFRVIADTPRGLQPFYSGAGTAVAAGKPYTATDRVVPPPPPIKPDLNLEIRKTFYESSNLASDSPSGNARKTYNCFTCGNDCTRVRYHSMKNRQYDLCANCFLESRLPATSQTSDFVKFEDTAYLSADRDREWTDQETLLLLEGMELYDDDWNAIADHIGTRTREQCVLKFLQLPIEDPYLETKTEELGPLQYDHIPLSQADNPVMSVVAFLASIVDPKVAAAAAQTALPEMTKAIQNQLNKATDKAKGTTEASSSSNGADAMDVDSKAAVEDDSHSTVKKAASIALGAAAARAHLLATDEEREMSRLVNELVNLQCRKLELKLAKFSELEQVLEAEKREIEQARQQLFLDRLAFQNMMQRQQQPLQQPQQLQ
ncbi:SWIRM domain-containing protein [Limtongia smithiae]|uniref:SWIRM domain-containing protein n=1 Tax=Limtongia smithiae TaxID=1125753 RepID=UPI0034CD03BF